MFDRTQKLEQYLLDVYRLKNVIRYNTRNKLKDESVAEHSFYVALFSLKLCDEYNTSEDIKCKCIIKALLHDMPEIELNDITHDVKEKLNLRSFLKTFEDDYFKVHFTQYCELMTQQDNVVDAIVDLADAMSVYQYTLNEIKLGNSSDDIIDILQEIKTRVQTLSVNLKNLLK